MRPRKLGKKLHVVTPNLPETKSGSIVKSPSAAMKKKYKKMAEKVQVAAVFQSPQKASPFAFDPEVLKNLSAIPNSQAYSRQDAASFYGHSMTNPMYSCLPSYSMENVARESLLPEKK